MEMDILSVLEHKFPSFSKGQRTIVQFILKNYDKAAFMTAARLGEVTGVKAAYGIRFLRINCTIVRCPFEKEGNLCSKTDNISISICSPCKYAFFAAMSQRMLIF